MNKYKVCVYAISKNEEKFVKRWVESMKEADDIYVLDTGSTDNTIKLLKDNNVIVKQEIIKPWRFDIARNISLNMIKKQYDIYVCTDLDEVFEKNWRKSLENIWQENTNRLKYIYNWYLDENNIPKISFYGEKIHSKNYKWLNPVHEILQYKNTNEIVLTTDNIVLNHYPDPKKSRKSYLPLLELSIKENPENDRNMHYLGREYMYYKKWNKAIDTLIKHLSLKSATWKDERCASMRFIARCYKNLKRYDEAKMWLDKAIKEAPYLRCPYVEMALMEYELNNYKNAKNYALKALEIKTHQKSYINEMFSWDHTIYDLLSLVYYNENNVDTAIKYLKKALKIAPTNKRLKNNLKIMEREKQNKNI